MSYKAICDALGENGEGIYDFGQSSFIKLVGENRKGICRGVATAWLKAKSQGNDYLKDIVTPTVTTGLLHSQKTATQASNLQSAYLSVSGDSTDSPSEATITSLTEAGIGSVGEKKAQTYQGFADDGEIIAQRVLTSGCRCFILSIKGTLGGHSVAFFRPWVFFGKSNECYFFDPNFGEFKLTGNTGIKACLTAVATAYSQGLSKGYRLWGFS